MVSVCKKGVLVCLIEAYMVVHWQRSVDIVQQESIEME